MDSETKKKDTARHSVKPDKAVYKDATWKDSVKKEKRLTECWQKKWDFLLMPENRMKIKDDEIEKRLETEGRRIGLISYQTYEKREIILQPSAPIPIKASGVIGWRSSNNENSFNLYTTKPQPHKIRFVDEEYGRYKVLKYLRKKPQPQEEHKKFELPSKFIRHNVNPLLC